MNKRTYILVFLLLLAGFTSELSAQKKPKKAKQEISVVSGQVVDSSGIPVAGALVTAMEGAYFARTDADGAFSVKSGAADYILRPRGTNRRRSICPIWPPDRRSHSKLRRIAAAAPTGSNCRSGH